MDPQIIDGRYQVIRELGKGGMGVVYEAKNIETSRRVAVKVIASALLAKGSDATARFKREAKAAGAIETQHVAQVLDAGRDAATGDPYIVMELLLGEDLKQLVERLGPLPPDLALRIAAQACVGLRAAHDSGIIHRDIKSANLVLARREGGELAVKIVDFGIAKVVVDHASQSQSADLTNTGSVLGSPRYLSPEQGKGQRDVTPRSDLWSLGVVLYEMLTGSTPHADIEGIFAVVMAICSQPTPPVQGRAPWVSAECAAIVHRALQIDPEKRFASAGEMLDAIRALLPDGTSIQESMLQPLSEEMKLHASAPLIIAPEVIAPSSGATSGTETGLNISQTTAAPRARAPRGAIFAAFVIAAAAGVGIAVNSLRGPRVDSASEPHGAAPPSAPPKGSTSAAPTETRSVRVLIEPPDAKVDVDGRATPVKDGAIELVGAIGSVHTIRVVKDASEAVSEVAITYTGAVPPSVRVDAPQVKPAQKPQPGPPAKPTRPPANTAAPALNPKDPPPATKFE